MATVPTPHQAADQVPAVDLAIDRILTPAQEAAAPAVQWGDAAALGLLALAVTTFILGMVNSDAVSAGTAPVIFGVALMFGGVVQLIAAIIQLRIGSTFTGVVLGGYAGLYLSLFAYVQWFAKSVPAPQAGQALGLFLYGFGIFALMMFIVSLRTNLVLALTLLCATVMIFFLAAGNYGAHTTLLHWGGYFGIATSVGVFMLALSGLVELMYGRTLRLGSLAKR